MPTNSITPITPSNPSFIPGKNSPANTGQSWRTFERNVQQQLSNILGALPITGSTVLVAGTKTLSIPSIPKILTNWTAQATHTVFSGTTGILKVTIASGALTITSSSSSDTGTIWYAVFPPSASPVPFQPYAQN